MKYLVLLLTLFLFSCQNTETDSDNEKIEEGEIINNRYTNEEIGWSITIPSDFKLIPAEEIRRQNEIGKEALIKGTGESIEDLDVIPLVAFRKDVFNMFMSSLQPIESDSFDFDKNQRKMIGLAYETLTKFGILVDSTIYTDEIDGLVFKVAKFDAFKETGEIMLTQVLYTRVIKNYVLGINFNYNSEENRKILLENLKNSTFKIRD